MIPRQDSLQDLTVRVVSEPEQTSVEMLSVGAKLGFPGGLTDSAALLSPSPVRVVVWYGYVEAFLYFIGQPVHGPPRSQHDPISVSSWSMASVLADASDKWVKRLVWSIRFDTIIRQTFETMRLHFPTRQFDAGCRSHSRPAACPTARQSLPIPNPRQPAPNAAAETAELSALHYSKNL